MTSTHTHTLEEILHPQSIAIVGASNNPGVSGYNFTVPFLVYGYQGTIYPVNPKYSEILGITAYPTIRDIPGSVDYVISCVPAAEVLSMLEDCSQKGVKCIHLFTARFSETGRLEATELEQEILKQARKLGIRLIGPNCMGVHYPRERISFGVDLSMKSGSAGAAAQSGGVTSELARLAPLRGVYFSKAISYGNALDFNECDYLDYFSQDPETKLIMMYVEGVRDGKGFFNALNQAASTKPVIVMKGGRGKSGARAVASHTASLAGSMKIWETLVTQAGAVSAESIDEMIDLAVSFYFLPPIRALRVGIAGGGGGTSVLAADQCEEAGLDVIPLPIEIREELRSKDIPIWDWISNPADMSIRGDIDFNAGDALQMMGRNHNFDLLIANLGEPRQRGLQRMTAEIYLEQNRPKESNLKPLLAVVGEGGPSINDYNSWEMIREVRTKLIAANIPFYPTIGRAARATRKLVAYYQKRK